MSSTKIINVLKDDKFDELLDIIKKSEASEVIFVLPKKTKAFKSDEQFATLSKEVRGINKSVSFLCSNPETNELVKKYNFEVLTAKTSEPRPVRPRVLKQKPELVAIPAVAKDDDLDMEDDSDEEEGIEDEEPQDLEKEIEDKDSREELPADEEGGLDYKEEDKKLEDTDDEPLYGTKTDDDGNIIYEEDEEENEGHVADEIMSGSSEFGIVTASAKTRGMSDVVRPQSGKNLKVAQKDRKAVKIETRGNKDDIESVFGIEKSDNIWSDIPRPTAPNRYRKGPGFFEKARSKNIQWIGILSVGAIVALSLTVLLTTGSAKIDIKPRPEKLDTQLKVSISPNFSSIDTSLNRVPGQLFTISRSASEKFNATAEKDAVQKARGIITIYNEYSTLPQPLVSTTRFELLQEGKESGLVFRTLKPINVPGMKVENGLVASGKISVEVIADKAGQNYNVSAGEFGVVAWREKGDTARYEKIYGRSSNSMYGGILGKAKVVSEFDYNNAQDQLSGKVKNDIDESLKTQSAGLELVTVIEPKIDSTESTAKIDDAADSFTMTVKGSILTVGFKKDDLFALVSAHIDATGGLYTIPDKIQLSFENAVVNSDNNTVEASVNIEGNGYAKIDTEEITNNLVGKNEAQIKQYLGAMEDVDSAKVILSPFWVNKIPKNKEKVQIRLTF